MDDWSVSEKVALTCGDGQWPTRALPARGVPSIVLSDGPHGVRRPRDAAALMMNDAEPATCFPTGSALAATWDPDLVHEVGAALGAEARALGVAVLLGPGANIKRTPLCGRNFEYFSEDPFLSATLATAWIAGVQGAGVGASLKHFAVNNCEFRRYGIDTYVDERALREIYLASFEAAVVEGRPATVMAAYNRLHGTHCTEHRWLLTDLLRGEWGFEGLVVSDWGATFDRVPAIAAGCDLQMPGFPGTDEDVVAAVRDGRLSDVDLTAAARRVVCLVRRSSTEPAPTADLDRHHALARRAAAAGTVLLRNDDGLLPLPPGTKLAVIGAFAREPRYQGAGSSRMNPPRVDDALSALREEFDVVYAEGYERHTDTAPDPRLLAKARAAARDCDVALVFVGLPETAETEGVDRAHLRLPAAHDALVTAVSGAGTRTVVILQNGAPVEMPWLDGVPAVVEAYLGGQAGGSALADVLTGRVEPGGRLAETFPVRWGDHPVSAMPVGPRRVEYRESLYVGYRYFDSAGVRPLFPFGHGLSYTTFSWGPLTVSDEGEVAVDITNTGDRAGSEVVQIYVRDEEAARFRPAQELKAFRKVTLDPGRTETVRLRLDRRAFAYWVPGTGWTVEAGTFEIRAGASSRDIRATATITLDGATLPSTVEYRDPRGGFPRDEFLALHGGPVPEDAPEYTMDTAFEDMPGAAAALLRGVLRTAETVVNRTVDDPVTRLLISQTRKDANPRILPLVSDGRITPRMARALFRLVRARSRP
ncbi:glycosyl hydrolase [Virgisporangium aliadipatigenens]|uniref:Exo-alpha-(1->6)-L-arabinopyranosidase n=1 Tax=Virgisporangium aliadipatigenens TaxID=741659 RepID=A0A8J3YHG7_9ACTN|nr:glycoside hydrolase family 3 C-terminal domain-containing protein [Virgisporangium aliadipatigenens]GIJ44347.1 glycosyl hydrolase [Virgisporangium aliadipatigenens]